MFLFWRTKKYTCLLVSSLRGLYKAIIEDLRHHILDIGRIGASKLSLHNELKFVAEKVRISNLTDGNIETVHNQRNNGKKDRPVIFASACVDSKDTGGWKYCGGVKELNYLVKLLRIHGYEAYMVTYDGTYESWLIEHQPHLSLNEFNRMLGTGIEVRCVTSWAISKSFIDLSPKIYFWDMELCCTAQLHYSILCKLYREKIINVATISRTIQAFHMAHFDKPATIIANLLDDSIWKPISQNETHTIGYMDEGPHTDKYIKVIADKLRFEQIQINFLQILGDEESILNNMCKCDVFLSMNIGKDPLWGEGCPRTIIEALSTGCVVIAFDIIGNRETLIHNYNGFIVPRYRPDLMGAAVVGLYKNKTELLKMRANGLSLIESCHKLESRWPAVQQFLDI